MANLDQFDDLWVTSHCLAETSNLLKQTHSRHSEALLAYLAELSKMARESHIPKNVIFDCPSLPSFGVADTGIILKSKRVDCVFTVDLDLYLQISKLGRQVVNFTHLRENTLLE